MLKLPPEIVLEIARTLDFRSILALASTCHQLRNVYKAYQELQYIIDLGVDGLVPTTSSSVLPIHERHALLLARRAARTEMRPVHKTSLRYHNLQGAFDLAGGVLAQYSHEEQQLVLHWLPTRTTPERIVEVEAEEIDNIFQKLALDPAQDLIVFLDVCPESDVFGERDEPDEIGKDVTLQVHLRTLSSYGRLGHQCALDPELFHACAREDEDGARDAQLFLAGSSIAVFINGEEPELIIWDWPSGALLVNLGPSDFAAAHLLADTFTFAFLSPNAFVLAGADLTGAVPVLQLVRLDRTRPTLKTLDSAVLLQLPELSGDRSIEQVNARSDPLSGPDPSHALHSPDPTAGVSIFVMQAVGDESDLDDVAVMFVVRTRTLLSYLAGGTPMKMEWAEWGPGRTRIIEHGSCDGLSVRPVSGSRVVFSTQYAEPPQAHLVLDFNVCGSPPKPFASVNNDNTPLANSLAQFGLAYGRATPATGLGHHRDKGAYEWTDEQIPKEQLPFICVCLGNAFEDMDEVLLSQDHMLRQRPDDTEDHGSGPGEIMAYAF